MKIPLYWSKATATETDRQGKQVAVSCWRSSDLSPEDAHQSALAAASRAVAGMISGRNPEHYPYPQGPLREEVVEKLAGPDGELYAAVTRNAFGALVLNTARAMFIDVDFDLPTLGDILKFFFNKLLGKTGRSPVTQREYETLGRLKEFIDRRPGWAARIYRTAGGMRVLVTHDLFDPSAEATLATLESFNADPLYVRLCKGQQCFRARLTPKPWRCGHHANVVRWPREDQKHEQLFQQWLADYDTYQAGYATCRFLGEMGGQSVHPQLETIVELHDRTTRAFDELPLA